MYISAADYNSFEINLVSQSLAPLEVIKCNFSLKYPYIIQQTGNENIQTYKVEFVALI